MKHTWAMAIDLDRCTGCGACVVACNAENNIPTVGEAEAGKNRLMHWIRVNRYWEGSSQRPRRSIFRFRACSANAPPASWSARCTRRITTRTG